MKYGYGDVTNRDDWEFDAQILIEQPKTVPNLCIAIARIVAKYNDIIWC